MSIKIKRIQSLESGDFNADGGRIRAHFQVPASVGFTDPHNSHLILRMTAECTSNGVFSPLVPCTLGERISGVGAGTIDAGGAQVLINAAKVVSGEYGLMNEQLDQNVVNANLEYYLQSSSGVHASNTYNGGGGVNSSVESENLLARSPFMVYSRPTTFDAAVTQESQQRYTEVRVPMKHIDRFADGIRQFPNVAVGDLTYEVQFETVRSVVGGADVNVAATSLVNGTTTAAGTLGDATNPLIHVPANGRYKEDNFNQIPFYVGQPVQLSYKVGAAPAATHNDKIVSLEVVSATGELNIILENGASGLAASTAATDMTLKTHYDNPTFRYNIQDAFLELHCLQLTPSQLDAAQKAMMNLPIPWYEYRLVKQTMNTTGYYSGEMQLPPSCAGVAIMLPENNQIVSGHSLFRHYHFSLDGKHTTTREIGIGEITNPNGGGVQRQLHNHMLQKWFGNIGKRLVKFDRPARNYADAGYGYNEHNHAIFPLVTPVVDRNLQLNFSARCTGAATVSGREVFYVSVHPRVLNFRNGRLQA